jgi:myosin heavy subunit
MILAPKQMQSAADEKEACKRCLEEVQLDPDRFRLGHTKARFEPR